MYHRGFSSLNFFFFFFFFFAPASREKKGRRWMSIYTTFLLSERFLHSPMDLKS